MNADVEKGSGRAGTSPPLTSGTAARSWLEDRTLEAGLSGCAPNGKRFVRA